MITLRPTHEELLSSFTDNARVASFVMCYVLTRIGYTRVPHKSGDLCSDGVNLWKVRALTHDGACFGPSVAHGAGRAHTQSNWEEGVEGLHGYIIYDHTRAPDVVIWHLTVETVEMWRKAGLVSRDGSVTRSVLLKKLTA